MLNDMMQSLLPAIYPDLKRNLNLNFGQIGVVTLVNQITASLLQPLVGLYADKRPTPLALPGGTLFTLTGLLVLSVAHTYGVLLVGAAMVGIGSSVFHPESSRVARMAAGERYGFAQSMFQVGGNVGSAAQNGVPATTVTSTVSLCVPSVFGAKIASPDSVPPLGPTAVPCGENVNFVAPASLKVTVAETFGGWRKKR